MSPFHPACSVISILKASFFGGFPAEYCSNVFFYGNTFNAGPGGGYALGVYAGGNGIHIFNNTFYGGNQGVLFWSGVDNSGAQVINNIFYNTSLGSAGEFDDYNAFYKGSGAAETHGITSMASDALVSPSTGNFHISATVGVNYPRDKGETLTANGSMNVDPDGNIRGANGAWDIGAYEVASISTNPVIMVSPTGINFGSILTNTTSSQVMVVQNTGGGTLAGTVTVAPPFSIVSGGSYSLAANQSQTVTISLSPQTLGSVTNTVTFTGGGGTTATVSGSGSTVPPPVVSAIASTSSDVDPNLAGLQIYAGSVVTYSASASDPNGYPLAWQWVYSINGGPTNIFASGTGAVASISYNYNASTAGDAFLWKLLVSNPSATAESDLAVGVESPPALTSSLTFQAGSGIITGPIVSTNGYIYETLDVSNGSITNGGEVLYNFVVTNAGNYVIEALVNAPNMGEKSFWVNINTNTPSNITVLPQNPTMITDIPLTSGFEERILSWRGNGTASNDAIVPAIFSLSLGVTNQLIIVGREANVQLQTISILQLPPPPLGLHIVTGP